jgi:erythronate-4-phosphate dehydrogenase
VAVVKIVADINIPFVREAFGSLGDVSLLPGRQINRDVLRDADVLLVRSVTPVNAALLEGTPVKFVGTATTGLDHIDEQYLASRGIGLASAAGTNANSVAEYVVVAMLELAQRGKFRLRDKTLGVVGVGNVGSRVVRFAEALGMRVLQNDPPRQQTEALPDFVSFERLLVEADIVTIQVPLLDTTRRMFHHDNLEKFFLINTARGAVVDNRALLKAIDGDRIPGALLDVWENEPDISPELLDVVDLGTPHIAGYSLDAKVNGAQAIYRAVCEFFKTPATWQSKTSTAGIQRLWMKIGRDDDDEDVLRDIIHNVYKITKDDRAFRKNPREFDRLRAEYPIRREFFNTTLGLLNASERLLKKCSALGSQLDSRDEYDFAKRA